MVAVVVDKSPSQNFGDRNKQTEQARTGDGTGNRDIGRAGDGGVAGGRSFNIALSPRHIRRRTAVRL